MSKLAPPLGVRLIGGGGHACVIVDAVRLAGGTIDGFFDDAVDASLLDLERLGSFADLSDASLDVPHIFAIGELSRREQLIGDFAGGLATVVHPAAMLAQLVDLGAGSFVGAGAAINSRTRIGPNAIVNTLAIVEHDCNLGSNVHVGPGAALGGGVQIGDNCLIGINASVRSNVSIGKNCTIGVGAAVVTDVADGQVMVGVPARPINQ